MTGRGPDPGRWRPDTLAVRGGLLRSGFDETSEALFLTSGYVYPNAAAAEAAFAGDLDHYMYSRYGNPTVSMFQERLRLMEGAPACFATATGMAAVFTALDLRSITVPSSAVLVVDLRAAGLASAAASAGLVAPNFRRTGFSPHSSSRW